MRSASERFWARVDKSDECWIWLGAKAAGGYGRVVVDGRYWMAHRFAYVDMVGPIPEGLELDHLCRVRDCVNPSHLEPVTHWENVRRGDGPVARNARKTECLNGHPLSGDNLMSVDARRCRTCHRTRAREATRRYRARQRANG